MSRKIFVDASQEAWWCSTLWPIDICSFSIFWIRICAAIMSGSWSHSARLFAWCTLRVSFCWQWAEMDETGHWFFSRVCVGLVSGGKIGRYLKVLFFWDRMPGWEVARVSRPRDIWPDIRDWGLNPGHGSPTVPRGQHSRDSPQGCHYVYLICVLKIIFTLWINISKSPSHADRK